MAPFKYMGRERTADDIKRRRTEAMSSYDSFVQPNFTMYKAKEGENNIRILPRSWAKKDMVERWGKAWDISIWVHYNVGPDRASYLCLDKMQGEQCPVCEARLKTDDPDEQRELAPRKRSLCWLIDRDKEKTGPQWWVMPVGIFDEIGTRSVDKKTGEGIYIDDPNEGFDVSFYRKGTGKTSTNYSGVEIMRDPSPLCENAKLQDRWLAFIEENPLPEILNFYDAEHIEKVLYGTVDRRQRDDDDEDERRPSRRASRSDDDDEPKSSRRSRHRDEEDDEDEKPSGRGGSRKAAADDDDDADEDEPKSKSTKRAAADEDDEEEEDRPRKARADEDEDDDDALPWKSRGRGKDADEDDEEEEDQEEREAQASKRRRLPKDEEDDEDESPSAQGRRQLSRLKGKAGRK